MNVLILITGMGEEKGGGYVHLFSLTCLTPQTILFFVHTNEIVSCRNAAHRHTVGCNPF